MTIDEIFNAYANSIKSKTSPPEWITSTPKSGLTRNITIEDWNSVIEDISHIASDCNTIDEFIQNYTDYVKTKNSEIEKKFSEYDNNFKDISTDLQDFATKQVVEMKFSLEDNQTLSLYSSKGEEITGVNLPFITGSKYYENTPCYMNLVLDTSTYKLYVDLTSVTGKFIARSNTIDLPIESMVVNASYSTGYLRLELQSGNTLDIGIAEIIDGLVNETDFESFQMDINGEIANLQNGITGLDRYATENINNLQDRVSELEENSGSNLTVEQEVNNSTNPVSSKAVKEVTDELAIKYEKLENMPEPSTLKPNTIYIAENPLTELRIDFEDGIYSLIFKVGTDFYYSFDYDGVTGYGIKYVGEAPDFQEGETWELNIMNGIVASGKVVSE